MTEPLLGRSVNRLEDERFVRGRGRYIADLAAPNALHGAVVRYVGEPVAFVVAESTEAARDAAEAIVVDYAPLPPVVSIADAVLPDAPSIWPAARGNIADIA